MRVEATRSLVNSWDPRDHREREAKRQFEEHLEKLANASEEDRQPEEDPRKDVRVMSSAVVLGPQGTLLHAHDLMPTWVSPGGHVEGHEYPWETAQRVTQAKTGIEAEHPEDGPRVVGVNIQETAEGHTLLDIRFLLFASGDPSNPPAGEHNKVRWFEDVEARKIAEESYQHALEVAHAIRDEAAR